MPELFKSIISQTMTGGEFAACLISALLCGLAVAAFMAFKVGVSRGFAVSLALLPPAVCLLLTMVKGNIGTGIAIAGAFSLVRFRSAAGKAGDIVAIFTAMTAGLTCATGFVLLALLFTVLCIVVAFGLSFIPIPSAKESRLKISVPETLDFSGAFEGILGKYTSSHRLVSVKTANMGSLYRLEYRIIQKDKSKTKELIDALRCENGNLEISVGDAAQGENEL